MKKLALVVLLSISFIIFPVISYVFAAELSLGASTWYVWWKDKSNDMNLDPTLLYGPAVSLRFADSWSLSGVFLYGEFSSKDKDSQNGGPDTITRSDSDLSLNYNISRYFKIFAGAKYMAYRWEDQSSDGTHWSVGPGLGIGGTFPLLNNLYLLINVSGTNSWGNHNEGRQTYQDPGTGTIYSKPAQSEDIIERSINGTASLAYYIAAASTSINLGFRYQYLRITYAETNNSIKDKNESLAFYGVTLSAVYSFGR